MVITVEHLTKRFGRFTAVDDLTFEVNAGEILAFLGPNGAGKTTTMRMLTGFLPPTRGRVTIDGFDMLDRPLDAKRRLGYLPENPPLYPEMTVRSYLGFVAEIKDVPAARRRAQVACAIERARLDEVAGKRINALSKGYKQRVGLAQAIVHEPPVLVLDEPTSSLDPKQRVEVRELIAGLRGSHTVILSTHILSEASEIADRVFIINRGRVMAVDTPARLGQQLRSREVVTVEIVSPGADGAEALRQDLAALSGVLAVSVEDAGATLRARVESEPERDVRGDVAAAIAARGWRLIGLGAEAVSLEQIFLKLTAAPTEASDVTPDRPS